MQELNSSETRKLVKTKDIVIDMLQKYPHLRDNDERLVATIWKKQLIATGRKLSETNVIDFLFIYAENVILTSADCIVRTRAIVQEQNINLRGTLWNERHKIGNEVTQEIHKV